MTTTPKVMEFITKCCENLPIKPRVVAENLLSVQDEADIEGGDLKPAEVIWIIDLWIKDGCPVYTDKPGDTPKLSEIGKERLRQIKEMLNVDSHKTCN